nr:hypothetical protein Iba_chr04dCG2830 [Ipomoea batatas]
MTLNIRFAHSLQIFQIIGPLLRGLSQMLDIQQRRLENVLFHTLCSTCIHYHDHDPQGSP